MSRPDGVDRLVKAERVRRLLAPGETLTLTSPSNYYTGNNYLNQGTLKLAGGDNTCVRSHEANLLEHGTTEDQIHDAVRIASVVHGVAVALDGASLISEHNSA